MSKPISAGTEIIDGVECRNVWLKSDPAFERAALALTSGTKEVFPAGYWSSNLCVACYLGGNLIALGRAQIRSSRRVRANLASLRTYTALKHRSLQLEVPVIMKMHEILRQHAFDYPQARLAGTMIILEPDEPIEDPVTKSFMILAGYTDEDRAVFLRWFEHYKL